MGDERQLNRINSHTVDIMRDQMIKALLAHAQGDIEKHKANVEIYLTNPAGIGEHSDIMDSVENELNMIAKYQDQIDVIQRYFKFKKTD